MLGFTRILRTSIPAYTTSYLKSSISKSLMNNNSSSIPKVDIKSKHLQISSMVGKLTIVPNSFVLMNIRQILLKSRSQVGGLLEEIDALMNSSMVSGLIKCMNLSIRLARNLKE